MNCPRCRMRQLSPNLFCCDCGIKWTQKQLDYFEERDSISTDEYNEDIRNAEKRLREKRACLLRALFKIE